MPGERAPEVFRRREASEGAVFRAERRSRYGVRTMRTSFFGYEKSKCALPVPTALLKGADAGGKRAWRFVLVMSRARWARRPERKPRL